MEQINLEDNQKELKSGGGRWGRRIFFHHWRKKIEKIARAVEGAARVISYLAFGVWRFWRMVGVMASHRCLSSRCFGSRAPCSDSR